MSGQSTSSLSWSLKTCFEKVWEEPTASKAVMWQRGSGTVGAVAIDRWTHVLLASIPDLFIELFPSSSDLPFHIVVSLIFDFAIFSWKVGPCGGCNKHRRNYRLSRN